MTKLPEPVIAREECAVSSGEYYTEAQMLQFRRDVLEEAASICFETEDSDDEYVSTRHTIAGAIRKLKDET
jgi:hypothetical protein